ncbi:MAG TPA: multiprotein bridging factor aMBF1 [Methanomicrobiales archaeon]|nr:multiprotein bridging factor aMBF1 [Methanomicrobiales archaeon]
MQCELCGGEIRGAPRVVHIEGAELRVCVPCSKYGTEVQRPRASTGAPAAPPRRAGAPPAPQPVQRRRRDLFDRMEGELAEDYADRIRRARVAKGWTEKQLALEIMERELLIKKVERGDLVPEEELRKKLEEVLGISLLESVEKELKSPKGKGMTTTLGDIISIKK